MTTNRKVFTWGKLKEFVNSIPEKELELPVNWWGDERGGEIENASLLEADYVLIDEYYELASDVKNEYDTEEEFNDSISGKLNKGTPILWVD